MLIKVNFIYKIIYCIHKFIERKSDQAKHYIHGRIYKSFDNLLNTLIVLLWIVPCKLKS